MVGKITNKVNCLLNKYNGGTPLSEVSQPHYSSLNLFKYWGDQLYLLFPK